MPHRTPSEASATASPHVSVPTGPRDLGQDIEDLAPGGPTPEAEVDPDLDERPSVVREWGPILIGALVFALIFRLFLFQAYSIPSTSMLPGLEVDDRVVVNKLSYVAHDVNRGDTVVFDRPANTVGPHPVLIKRVIGLPGETVEFIGGEVYVDDQLVQESYLEVQADTWPITGIPNCIDGSTSRCTIPEGHVLVLGDNRARSTDGRSFGPIPIDSIVGRAFVKFWPLSDAALL